MCMYSSELIYWPFITTSLYIYTKIFLATSIPWTGLYTDPPHPSKAMRIANKRHIRSPIYTRSLHSQHYHTMQMQDPGTTSESRSNPCPAMQRKPAAPFQCRLRVSHDSNNARLPCTYSDCYIDRLQIYLHVPISTPITMLVCLKRCIS